MKNKMTPGNMRQQMVWKHNGLVGGCRLFETVLTEIIKSESTTYECKGWAVSMLPLVRKLAEMMKVRSDHRDANTGV